MDRRRFLGQLAVGGGALALSGCQARNQPTVQVRSLRGSVPGQLQGEFAKRFNSTRLDLKPEAQLQTLFEQLQRWKRQSLGQEPIAQSWLPFLGGKPGEIADWVTIGDAWLQTAIQQDLIVPLDPPAWRSTQASAETQLNALSPQFQNLAIRAKTLQRSQSPQIWGVPYRWGSTVIVYRKDILAQQGLKPPTDWADLWQPAFKGRISLPDQAREVIGLTLKKSGQSYNLANLTTLQNLAGDLKSLNQQTKFYSSTQYLPPLLLGHTWLAVGWSTDVLQQMRRDPSIEAVFPSSGTALWADLWVRPVGLDAPSQAALQWLELCLNPEVAAQFSLFSNATATALDRQDPTRLPVTLQRNAILLPPADRLDRSEFLQPLSIATRDQYAQLWQQMRS